MRIALIAGEDPGWGGIGTYTGVLGRALRELGHDPLLVLRGWEDDGPEGGCDGVPIGPLSASTAPLESLDGLPVHRVTVPEPSWRRGTEAVVARLYGTREALLFARGAARAVAAIAPDVVEAPEFGAPGLLAGVRSRVRGRGEPVVVTRLHAPSFLTARLAGASADLDLRASEALEAAAVRVAAAVSAPSRALAGVVARRWWLDADRVRVIPNPIDESLFAPGSDAEVPGRIVIVGRVERAKGHDVLLEALPAVRAAVPGTHVVAVGADGDLAEALRRRAAALGLGDGAFALAGARERALLPACYRSAAVCVVPSRFEAFSYTALEAMACGRAVVASDVGGVPEAVGEAGVLVAPERPDALAGALIALLGNAERRRSLGGAARRRIVSRFAAPAVAAQMVDHYKEVARWPSAT